jgi:DNA polymerase-1
VRAYLEEVRDDARRTGKVATLFGRIRWIAGLDSRNAAVRGNAERMAINAPVQGTAADLMKLAMIRLQRALDAETAHLLLQVHDELVLEVAEGAATRVAAAARDAMEGVAELQVALRVDTGTGRSWADAKG